MAFVQNPAGVTSTGTGTVTSTFAAAGAGNLLVFAVGWSQVPGDVALTAPGGLIALSNGDISATTKVRGQMFYKVAAGGETSQAFSLASGTNDMAVMMVELSGVRVIDQVAENTGTTSPSGTGTLASTATGENAVGFIAINNNNSLTTPQNSYTSAGTVVSGNATAANQVRLGLLYFVSGAAPATSSGYTQGGTARSFVGQIAAFKPIVTMAAVLQGVATSAEAVSLAFTLASAQQGVALTTSDIQPSRNLAASQQGVAIVTADLTVTTGGVTHSLAASLQGVATSTEDVLVSRDLAAPLQGVAVQTTNLTRGALLASSLQGVGIVTTDLTRGVLLASGLQGVGVQTADLRASRGLSAALQGVAVTTSSLLYTQNLAVALQGIATVTAGAKLSLGLSTSLAGVAFFGIADLFVPGTEEPVPFTRAVVSRRFTVQTGAVPPLPSGEHEPSKGRYPLMRTKYGRKTDE